MAEPLIEKVEALVVDALPDVVPPELVDLQPRARLIRGEKAIARILRGGALASGGLFLGSVLAELLPTSQTTSVAIDLLRKGGASLLLVTPAVRLVVAGGLLGLRGEYKYTAYAIGVLLLLAIAVGAGFAA